MVIDGSEKEDFEGVISKEGMDISDFEITEEDNPMRGSGVQPITGRIKILRKSTGGEKTYESGHGKTWLVQFGNDLEKNIFD